MNRQVPDPELREKLTPDYTMGCKRILISDNYLPSLNKPNVDVVTDGVKEIREHSIVTGEGREPEVVRTMREVNAITVEVRPEVQEAYNERIQGAMEGTVWTAGNCQSWYLDDTGRNTTLWPTWSFSFRRRTRRFDPGEYALGTASQQPAGVRAMDPAAH